VRHGSYPEEESKLKETAKQVIVTSTLATPQSDSNRSRKSKANPVTGLEGP
jgi:hypothetical protein